MNVQLVERSIFAIFPPSAIKRLASTIIKVGPGNWTPIDAYIFSTIHCFYDTLHVFNLVPLTRFFFAVKCSLFLRLKCIQNWIQIRLDRLKLMKTMSLCVINELLFCIFNQIMYNSSKKTVSHSSWNNEMPILVLLYHSIFSVQKKTSGQAAQTCWSFREW